MAPYSSQSTEGTSPDTPDNRASASSASRLVSTKDSAASAGLAGGNGWGTKASATSPRVVDWVLVPVVPFMKGCFNAYGAD